MDKLKPILTHKFWILAAVALLLPIVGWYMGTGKVAAEIDTRVAAINGLSVPAGNQIPNDDWMTKAKVVQDERQERLDTAADYLWDAQQEYMTWPPNMQGFVQDTKFGDELTLTGEEEYRSSYDVERENLLKIVDPLRWDEMAMKQVGRVYVEPTALATLPLDASIWPTSPPSSKEVWYLQEELWLLRGLLESVRDVNDKAGADSIVKAPIKQIDYIQLQGGDMAALEAAASGEAGFEGEGGMEMGMGGAHSGAPSGMTPGGMMEGGGYGEGTGAGAGGLDFTLSEEVGPNTPVAEATEGEEGLEGEGGMEMGMGGAPGAMPGGSYPGAAMGGMYGGDGMTSAPNPLLAEKRYVDDDATAPFKTRAFKMQVVMDHRQLPEFLAELTNSPFPVRILRVHWAELNQDPRFSGSGGGGYEGSMPGGSRGMSPMGGGYNPPGMSTGRGMGSIGGSRGMSPMGGGYNPPGMSTGRGMGSIGGSRGMSPMGGGYNPPGMSTGRGMGSIGGSRGMSPMGGGYNPPGMSAGRGMGPGARPGMIPGMSTGGEAGYAGDTGTVDLYSQAMSNPYLAQVVVGGLMTIYRSPQEMAAAAEGETAEGAEEVPAEEAVPTVESDEAATPEGETPADETTPPVDDGVPPADGDSLPADASNPADTAVPADGTAAEAAAPAEDVAAEPGSENAPALEGTPDPAPVDTSGSEQPVPQ